MEEEEDEEDEENDEEYMSEEGYQMASHLVAAFQAGRFRCMNTFLTPECPLLRWPALARVLAASPHAPPLPGPDKEEVQATKAPSDDIDDEEEEMAGEKEMDEDEAGEGPAAQPSATLRNVFFRVENNKESLGEVTTWLRRGMAGEKGLMALEVLEVRSDELGGFVGNPYALYKLVTVALKLPTLQLLVLSWRLDGWEDEEDKETTIGSYLWSAVTDAPPVPQGRHFEAILFHVRDQRQWRHGFLAIGPRLPG